MQQKVSAVMPLTAVVSRCGYSALRTRGVCGAHNKYSQPKGREHYLTNVVP